MGMKLKAYKGPEHPHQAQMPVKVEIPVRANRARKAS
jgi:ribosomal protein L13